MNYCTRCAIVLLAFVSGLGGSASVEAEPSRASLPTLEEIADFWDTVFTAPAPLGVPPLNATLSNERTINNNTVWDVQFDSYMDPGNDQPVRLGGAYAIPNNITPPGPGGTYPGLVVTHSVGQGSPDGPAADDVEGMATWFAQKGFATLAFFMRGWGTSQMSIGPVDNTSMFTTFLAADGELPLDNRWTGMAVDCFQAGEFLATRSEVWNPNDLAFVGHSGGGYAVLAAGIFSNRFSTISCSAPAGAWPNAGVWLDYAWGNGGFTGVLDWINSQPDPVLARSLVERTLTFTSMYNSIDNPWLVTRNPTWRLDNIAIFFYGGQADTSIPPWDVEANFLLADPSDDALKAFHWSPTGGHGGPESWRRTQAWVAGHYPGISTTMPIASLSIVSINDPSVTVSAAGSQAWEYDWDYDNGQMSTNSDDIVSFEYDFGDGTTMNWGSTVSHTYASAGTYTISLRITDGGGLRDTDSVVVTVDAGSGSNTQLQVSAENPEVVPEGGSSTFIV